MQSLVILLSLIVISYVVANTTVEELDVEKYLGLWYQMYADRIVYNTIEKDNFCVTALYGDNGDGTISVHNYARVGAANGTITVIDGFAYAPDASQPGQLKVHFDDATFPVDGAYWVLALGPVNSDNLYDYAIVSDNINYFLFVLARDVEIFNTVYDAEVRDLLVTLGFTGINSPIATYQSEDCVYEADERAAIIAKSKQQVQ